MHSAVGLSVAQNRKPLMSPLLASHLKHLGLRGVEDYAAKKESTAPSCA